MIRYSLYDRFRCVFKGFRQNLFLDLVQQHLPQIGIADRLAVVGNHLGDGVFLTENHQPAFGTGDSGVEQIAVVHLAAVSGQRHDHRFKLAALTFVDGDGIAKFQLGGHLKEIFRHPVMLGRSICSTNPMSPL